MTFYEDYDGERREIQFSLVVTYADLSRVSDAARKAAAVSFNKASDKLEGLLVLVRELESREGGTDGKEVSY